MRSTYSNALNSRFTKASLPYLVLISLASFTSAESAELFIADTTLQNDFSSNLPGSGSYRGFEYEIVQGNAVFEGDILLGKVDERGNLARTLQSRGVGVNDFFSRWPDGIVIYEFPHENSRTQKTLVTNAIQHWTEHTSLSFVERTVANAEQYDNYIKFEESNGCASHVGMIGGDQPIFISDACSIGSVIHEIGHAVGLFHEHTRPDRNNFVTIDWAEIQSSKVINFDRQTANVDTYSDYDYGSIMHYGEHFFSSSGNPTIIVANGIEIGQREALSALDVESVNTMYETDLALGTPVKNLTAQGLEIDITVNNLGELGAHQLELFLYMADNSTWTGVSVDSEWKCLAFDNELKCTKEILQEFSASTFTVGSTSTNSSNSNLSMRLISRTQDSNPENNGFNDDNIEWVSFDKVQTQPSSADFEDKSAEPQALAANVVTTSDDQLRASESTSSGSLNYFLLMTLLLFYIARCVLNNRCSQQHCDVYSSVY